MTNTVAIIENDMVTNKIVATLSEAKTAWPDAEIIDGDGLGIGWKRNENGVFAAPPAPPPAVPQSITMRQARLALLGAGLLSKVDTAINALPEPQKSAAKITWEYSQEVQRHNGFVSQLGPALGMTDAQIDMLFTVGATL